MCAWHAHTRAYTLRACRRIPCVWPKCMNLSTHTTARCSKYWPLDNSRTLDHQNPRQPAPLDNPRILDDLDFQTHTESCAMRKPCATLRNGVSLYTCLLKCLSPIPKFEEFKKLKVQISLHFDFEMLSSGLLEILNYCCFCLFKETQFFNFATSWRQV